MTLARALLFSSPEYPSRQPTILCCGKRAEATEAARLTEFGARADQEDAMGNSRLQQIGRNEIRAVEIGRKMHAVQDLGADMHADAVVEHDKFLQRAPQFVVGESHIEKIGVGEGDRRAGARGYAVIEQVDGFLKRRGADVDAEHRPDRRLIRARKFHLDGQWPQFLQHGFRRGVLLARAAKNAPLHMFAKVPVQLKSCRCPAPAGLGSDGPAAEGCAGEGRAALCKAR